MNRQRIVVVALFLGSSLLIGFFVSYAVAYGIDKASSLATVATLLAGVVSGGLGIWKALAARPVVRDGPIVRVGTRAPLAAGLAVVVLIGLGTGTAVTAASGGRGSLDGLFPGRGGPSPSSAKPEVSGRAESAGASVPASPSATVVVQGIGSSAPSPAPTAVAAVPVPSPAGGGKLAGATGAAVEAGRIVEPAAGTTTHERFITVTAAAPAPASGHVWYVVVQPGNQAASHFFYPTALVSTNRYRASQTILGPSKLSAGVTSVEFSVHLADVTAAGDREIRQHWANDPAYNISGMDHLPEATALADTITVRRMA